LRRFAEQGSNVSDKPSSTYAPSVFANEPEVKTAKATKQAPGRHHEAPVCDAQPSRRLRGFTFKAANEDRGNTGERQ